MSFQTSVSWRAWGVGVAIATLLLVALAGVFAPTGVAKGKTVNVLEEPYGAAGDGTTNDRLAIQRAIDDVAQRGGGTVVLPERRTFLSGSLILGSRVTLRVDGTLQQSQRPGDYGFTPVLGHRLERGIGGDIAMLHNTPMVHAAHAQNVKIEGEGAIQLTRASEDGEKEDETIHVAAIGLYDVTGFSVRDLDLLGASNFTVALYSSREGRVSNVRIESARWDSNTDGISIQNSQDIRVTRNTLRTGDDGIYVWSSYQDPRGGDGAWWSSENPQPSTNIEIDHNDVSVRMPGKHGGEGRCCNAFAFIPWGSEAPDQRQVQISDIYVHDNRLAAAASVGCWCHNIYVPHSPNPQSPITGVRIEGNEYIGPISRHFEEAQITDLTTDFGAFGSRAVTNGDFEHTGEAWWTPEGRAGATRADQPSPPGLRGKDASDAIAASDGWTGYLIAGDSPATLSQGIRLAGSDDYPRADSVAYRLEADVVAKEGTSMHALVRDTCSGDELARRVLSPSSRTHLELRFSLAQTCGNVRMAFRATDDSATDDTGWALVDNAIVHRKIMLDGREIIDNDDPRVTTSGGQWRSFYDQRDIGGIHFTGLSVGATATVEFTGTRAVIVGLRSHNLGKGDVFVDGTLMGTIDFYWPWYEARVDLFDTGRLPPGEHTIRLVTTGEKNPLSGGIFTTFDALAVTP